MGRIVVFFGLIASGKSTLAAAVARQKKMLYLNTDRVRKELAGLRPTDRGGRAFGQGIYTAQFTEKTYQAMLDRAAEQLQQGEGVVLDGSYSRRSHRAQVEACARRYHTHALFILCHCSDTEVQRRLALRAQDPSAVSDGHWEIYLRQKESFEPPDEIPASRLLSLNTEEALASLVSRVEAWLDARSL